MCNNIIITKHIINVILCNSKITTSNFVMIITYQMRCRVVGNLEKLFLSFEFIEYRLNES